VSQPVIVTYALGAGATPAGSSSGGSGSPATTTSPPPEVYLPDRITGQSQTGRYIDPATGQYALDVNGDFIGMGTLDQLVQIAICDIDFASAIDTIDSSTAGKMQNLLQDALSLFTNQNLMQIVRVNASQIGVNGEGASLVWRDLTQGPNAQERITPIGG
jgi:hypothetical protein